MMNWIRRNQKYMSTMLIVFLLVSCFAYQSAQIKTIATLFKSIVAIEEMKLDVEETFLTELQWTANKKIASHRRMELATQISECMDEAFGNIGDVLELICELVKAAKGETKNDDYVFENYVEFEFYSPKSICKNQYKKLFQEQCSVEEKTRLGGAPPGLFFMFSS